MRADKLRSEPHAGEGFSHNNPSVMHGAERIKDDGAPPFLPARARGPYGKIVAPIAAGAAVHGTVPDPSVAVHPQAS